MNQEVSYENLPLCMNEAKINLSGWQHHDLFECEFKTIGLLS